MVTSQLEAALEVDMRQAELMCNNFKVEYVQAVRATESSVKYDI